MIKNEPKLCIDCIHYIALSREALWCARERKQEVNLVTGIIEYTDYTVCKDERKPYWFARVFYNPCGPDGKFYIKR